MRRIWVIGAATILVLGSFVAYTMITKPQTGEIIASFTYCGCGGCGGQIPVVKEIRNKGQFDTLKHRLVKPPESACLNVGCSLCTEYRLIAT